LVEFTADIERIVAGLPRAEHVRAAAAAQRGPVALNVGANLFLTSRHTSCDPILRSNEQRIVDGVALDDIWSERALEGPGLIKIDVEGAELDVLRGAREALRRCEYLILEVAVRDIFHGAPRADTVIGRLAEYGFLVDDILEPAHGPRGELYTVDIAFAPERGWLRLA
jgi:FkbM family methyltransferase